ncbi:MAG TPA: Mur ligase family protein [Candidatus Limnocylindria bacterium]|nr:Mur ligase family protein [Candidatus Limnocylindria bacterium]
MTTALAYAAAVRELRERGRFGIGLGLERVTAILDELGHPERALHGALVAGTNGKGSVVALARSALAAACLRTGTMPKPHLVSYRERIAIDGVPLSEDRFAAALASVLPAVDRVAARLGPPTEFEVLTAAAYAELARAGVDLALVEVGLGGRLDATNVLDPGVAVITNVQHDHERHLGRTLAAIGAEKAAIIKRGNLAVTGATGRGLRPILDRCAALDVPLRRAGSGQPYAVEVRHVGWDGLVVDARTPSGWTRDLHVRLLGRHQASNAAVALALLDALRDDGERRGKPLLGLDEAAVREGFERVSWPGRMELLPTTRLGRVLLDGAHNPAGARALADALDELGLRSFPLVFGAMRGKRVSAVLRALAPLRPNPVFTQVEGGAAIRSRTLQAAWRRITGSGGQSTAPPAAALELAATLRQDAGQPIVVAGSLYLVGDIRGMLRPQEDGA